MPTFLADDGLELAFHVHGEGDPLICLAGGPMRDTDYLGELGGLSAHRQLVMFDLRGTGGSAVPADVASYRCDRLVGDLEALRNHLRLDRMDLLSHSAGANLVALYAAQHPRHVGKLALITPSTVAVGIAATGASRIAIAELRKGETWFEPAFAALQAIVAGDATDARWDAIVPFSYGRWDAAARVHHASYASRQNTDAAAVFGAEGAFNPSGTRAALASLTAPVLLLAGEVDLNSPPVVVAEFAELFANAELVVQSAAGHVPWVDDAELFVSTTSTFLA